MPFMAGHRRSIAARDEGKFTFATSVIAFATSVIGDFERYGPILRLNQSLVRYAVYMYFILFVS